MNTDREQRWAELQEYKRFLIDGILRLQTQVQIGYTEEQLKRMTTRTLERIYDNI